MKESFELGLYWKNEGEPNTHRDYDFFAILAGVKNRNSIESISEPKGVSKDCAEEYQCLFDSWGPDAHSASWLTLHELKEYKEKRGSIFDGYDRLQELIEELDAIRIKRNLSDEEVRVQFFFDN